MGNRVQVDCVDFAPEPQRFQRDGPTPCKWIKHLGSFALGVGTQKPVSRSNQLACRFEIMRIMRVFPFHQMLDVLQAAVSGRVLGGRPIAVLGLKLVSAQEVVDKGSKSLWAIGGIRVRYQGSE